MNVLHTLRKDPNFFEGILFGLVALAITASSQFAPGNWWFNALGFVSFLLFFSLALGNFMFPAKTGHVFLPLYRWWQENGVIYEIREHAGRKYYSYPVDPNCHNLFNKKGWQVGWHLNSMDEAFRFVPWDTLRKDEKPPRMHWLARMRSPSIA